MARQQAQPFTFARVRGRNGWDPPLSLGEGFAREVKNVDFWDGELGRKRGGSNSVSLTGVSFTGNLSFLGRHVPGSDQTAAELWAFDNAATPVTGRLTGGTTWATVTPKDNISTRPQDAVGVSLNGKYYTAYDSTQNRLHVWDGTSWRRVGLATPNAPTAANTGSGSYAATIRYYKVAYQVQSGGTVLYQSELSSVLSFTPSGSGTAARVTKPATISESETHWVLYGSADQDVFYKLATTVVGTTTVDDSTDPSQYADGSRVAEPLVGSNLPPPSAKFLATINTRLVMFGCWETTGGYVTPKNDRVWFTEPIGASDVGDDERVPFSNTNENFLDLGENDGGIPTGLIGPFQDAIYAFKYNSIVKLVPTGDDVAPFRPVVISRSVGAIAQKSILEGEDQNGNPALYFLAADGPRRYGANGIEWLGYDIQDVWDTINLDATTVVAHGVYHRPKKQVWWWIATAGANTPNALLVFDVTEGRPTGDSGVRYGWSYYDGLLSTQRCSVMFANTLGASMSRDLKPYAGGSTATKLYKGDTTATADDTTSFQAYIDLPAQVASTPKQMRVTGAYLLAQTSALTSLSLTLTRDFGIEARTFTQTLDAKDAETEVYPRIEDAALQDISVLQTRIGDAAAASTAWILDRLTLQVEHREER